MNRMKTLTPLVMLALFMLLGLACSNSDNTNQPTLPNYGTDGPQGDPIQTSIPLPFSQVEFGVIEDIALEKDGDLAISDQAQGIFLFDPFGELKRNISEGSAPWDGMVDVRPGMIDSGRGIIATGGPVDCGWASHYDDEYVTGGTFFGTVPGWWWDGEAHPPS